MTIRVYFRCHEQCLISINFRKSPGFSSRISAAATASCGGAFEQRNIKLPAYEGKALNAPGDLTIRYGRKTLQA
ncbi:hypothetical protein [Bifidobacterium bifidum]|uniref:hypothetical protein n=1 Tax=Bifidobacterium bifidum TaxID=1681 RepID=UPI0018653D83|nr:hypothetical protein [Bifidobacterium bifidum]